MRPTVDGILRWVRSFIRKLSRMRHRTDRARRHALSNLWCYSLFILRTRPRSNLLWRAITGNERCIDRLEGVGYVFVAQTWPKAFAVQTSHRWLGRLGLRNVPGRALPVCRSIPSTWWRRQSSCYGHVSRVERLLAICGRSNDLSRL